LKSASKAPRCENLPLDTTAERKAVFFLPISEAGGPRRQDCRNAARHHTNLY